MPIGTAAAGLIAAGITAAGNAVSSGLNAWSQARTNAQNRAQADYAFKQQQQAIRDQNVYNSPAQQVLRMKAAGLNPSLAYGADGAMVGNQTDIPAYQPIPAEAPNVGQIGAGLADAIRTGIDVRDFQRRQDLATAEIAAQSWQNYLAFTQGQLNEGQVNELMTLLGYKVESYESQNELNWEKVLETRAQVSKIHDEMAEIRSRVKLNEQQIDTLAAQAGLSRTQAYAILQRLPYEIAEMDAQAAFEWAQTAVGQETVKSIARDIRHVDFVEYANKRDYNFEVQQWKTEQKKWNAEMTQQRRMGFLDAMTKVVTFGIGASAYRHGQSIPRTGGAD